MKIDLHVHSNFSRDSQSSPKNIIRTAKKIGLSGLSITDHNEIKAFEQVKEFASEHNIILIRGSEISTTKGHLLALGIDQKIERNLSPERTLELISDAGGICIIAHPFRKKTGIGEKDARILNADAIETINARLHNASNDHAIVLAKERGLPAAGGSDSHKLDTIGRAWTEFSDNISTEEELLEEIRRGNITANGTGMSTSESLKYASGALSRLAKRGFKKV